MTTTFKQPPCDDCVFNEYDKYETGLSDCTNNDPDEEEYTCFRPKMSRAEWKAAEEW